MSRGSEKEWDDGNNIPVHFGSQSERSRSSDHDNSIPVHFSRTSSRPSSGYGNPMSQPFYGPTDWQTSHHFPSSLFRQASLDPRFVATNGGRPLEESAIVRGNAHSRFPFEPYPPVRIFVIRSMARESGPRMAPFSSNLPPRFPPQVQETVRSFQDTREEITKLEQEKALKTLKKQIYSSDPKSKARRPSLFYRNITGKGKESDEDSKRCSVCLEDFEVGNEFMLTPCNHMFHEECIVPWMKSNGQCPVCRFVVSEPLKANAMALSDASVPPPALLEEADGRFISEHVLSVIRAMDDAFSWGRSR